MPKMLTVDEEFERIVAGVRPAAKMRPLEEPEPRREDEAEDGPSKDTPSEES